MCGIAGIYNFRTLAPANRQAVAGMNELLSHRGPDADGVFFCGPVGLGHRRLSILDLDERGRQPMETPDGRFVITYNGEIYNYVELRRELESQGHHFRTDTDTEVLLTLYATEGAPCLSRLNGMFAFAIWDSAKQCLFIARDRMGIKPLYYAETPDGLIFASEAKALFVSGQLQAEVDHSVIDTYMSFGYVPGEGTLFRHVRKLLPGWSMTVSTAGKESKQYWDLSFQPNLHRGSQDTADELRALLLDSVKIHLRSDVPVGVFLSGGLDSSAIVSLLAEAGIEGMNTFSVAYREGGAYDESAYAQKVADFFQTKHHTLYVKPDQFLEFIPGYVWHMDEPVTEAAALSLYFISKVLKTHVTVALSGEGADELFAGYDIYRYMQWIEYFRKIPEPLRIHILEPLLGGLGNQKVMKYLRLAQQPIEERYRGVSLPDLSYKDALYADEFRAKLYAGDACANPLSSFFEKTEMCDVLTRMLYSDCKSWLVDDLLIKADKMTMANSVELRVPFLDYRVVEYAGTIPSNLKIHGRHVKWILKKAMAKRLPEEIISRKKVGFPTPLGLMFQNDLSSYLRDLLLSPQCSNRGYFKPEVVQRLITEHTSKQRDHHQVLWQLVVLEEWHKQFIDMPIRVPNSFGNRGQAKIGTS